MNILISGGSGFLGKALSEWVHENVKQTVNITWLSRDTSQSHPDYIKMMSYEELQLTQQHYDVIINLAGAGIADQRWSDERKRILYESRLKPTQSIIDYIARVNSKPKLLLSGSAIGWYGAQGSKPLDESSPHVANGEHAESDDEDFAHQLCERWEKEATGAQSLGVDVALLRTGVVIHPEGGMIERLLTPFKMGAGGKLGDGQQIMSWISREDWIRATWFIISHHLVPSGDKDSQISGKLPNKPALYNLTAPNPVTNAEFTKALGLWLNRPTFMTLPEFVLKTMFGEMATLLVDGQKVLPKALLELGFQFNQPTLKQALEDQNL